MRKANVVKWADCKSVEWSARKERRRAGQIDAAVWWRVVAPIAPFRSSPAHLLLLNTASRAVHLFARGFIFQQYYLLRLLLYRHNKGHVLKRCSGLIWAYSR